MDSNNERVGKGIEALKTGLVYFVSQKFVNCYRDQGQVSQILPKLEGILGYPLDRRRPFRDMDAAALLKVMWVSWNDVFRDTLGPGERSLVGELRAVRNNWAHQKPFSDDNAYRALDSMCRLLLAVSSDYADTTERLKTEQLKALMTNSAETEETSAIVESVLGEVRTDKSVNSLTESKDSLGQKETMPFKANDDELSMDCLLQALSKFDALRDEDIVSRDTVERVEPIYSDRSLFGQINPKIAQAFALFRAGLSDKHRHDIQQGMRDGSKKVVFSTNALELGIDIGGLDGVILAGFPDTVMSAWQRIGRAGRGWDKDAFVLYYSMNDPVNKFYAANLSAFLKKPLDEIVADPANEELIGNHIPSLLYESGGAIHPASENILGSVLYQAVRAPAEDFRPVKNFRPHPRLEIRGSGGIMWTLKYNNEEIGAVSDYQKFREAYEGAIYLQAGRKYKVDSTLAGSSNEIHLVTPDLEHSRTKPVFVKSLNIQELFDAYKWEDDLGVYWGKVSLSENVISVSLVDELSDNLIDRYAPSSNSSWHSTSHAFWVDVSSVEDVDDEGLTAFEQLLRVGTIFTIPVDSHDTTTHTVKRDKQIYLIESHPGGIGIVKKALEKWHEILKTAIGVARDCRCRKGCPNCIIPPRLYDEEVDKFKGIGLAERV